MEQQKRKQHQKGVFDHLGLKKVFGSTKRERGLELEVAQLTDQLRKANEDRERITRSLETVKNDYLVMSTSYYKSVQSVRAVEADWGVIQIGIQRLQQRIQNYCNGRKLKASSEKPESSYGSLFANKIIMDAIVERVFKQPIRLGISVNTPFRSFMTWMEQRDSSWNENLKVTKKVVAVVNELPETDVERININNEKVNVVNDLCEQLASNFPTFDISKDSEDSKYIEEFVDKALELDFAIKSMDTYLRIETFEAGKDRYDERTMDYLVRSPKDGIVQLVVTPMFVYGDDEQATFDRAKVLCS